MKRADGPACNVCVGKQFDVVGQALQVLEKLRLPINASRNLSAHDSIGLDENTLRDDHFSFKRAIFADSLQDAVGSVVFRSMFGIPFPSTLASVASVSTSKASRSRKR